MAERLSIVGAGHAQARAARGANDAGMGAPAETILAGIVHCDRIFQKNGAKDDSIKPDDLLKRFATSDPEKLLVLQIGGKATVGRGQMRCVFTPANGGGR